MPSNFVLSAEDIEPAADVVAAEIEIAGDVPPDETIGAVPVTEATAAPDVMPSNFVLSAALIDPGADVVAAVILIAGFVPPLETIGAVPVTDATPPPPPPPVELIVIASVPAFAVNVMFAPATSVNVPDGLSATTFEEPATTIVPNAFAFTCAPAAIPSSLVLSAADIEPAALVVAALIAIVGVVPPVLVIGAVAPTEATREGMPVRSAYAPDVATAASVGLFRIAASPVDAFQSAFTFTSAPAWMPSSFA
jgi:hypothetical protein